MRNSNLPYALDEPGESAVQVLVLLLVFEIVKVGTSGGPAMVHRVELVCIFGRKRLRGDGIEQFLVLKRTGNEVISTGYFRVRGSAYFGDGLVFR